MKYLLKAFILAVFFLISASQTVSASDSLDPSKPLCLPGVYLTDPVDCLPLGPSQKLTDLARSGINFPLRPLPAIKPDKTLAVSPVSLARINLEDDERAPIYYTLSDAIAGENPSRYIPPGVTRYMSFIDVAYNNDKAYIRLRSGEWMRASPVAYSDFQGLIFTKTPLNSFGWIVDQAEVRRAPGYEAPLTGILLYRENVVQIYSVQALNGVTWYMIGPDQWVERRYIRQVRVNTNPPPGVNYGRWIEVNLYDQTLSVYQNNQLIFATLVASGGAPFYTRPGVFQVYEKKDLETMSGSFTADRSDYYYLEDVPWTMYFDQARALHGAYWRAWFGYAGTHGCVNLSIGDSAWLYQWAEVGDWVYVWDPSDETPTDPSFYTSGGA